MRILVVCLGNICRSPIAEGLLRYKAKGYGLNWEIASAGTESYHIGEPPHKYSQKVCLENGVDISMQRARKFTVADFELYDKIYAMADDVYKAIQQLCGSKTDYSKLELFLNELMPGSNASVPDPWYGEEKGYKPVFDLINKGCDAIVFKYGRKQ